jgi:hypothetical protein
MSSISSPPPPRKPGKSTQLRVQDILTHLVEYHAETDPTEQRIYERAFISWFRVHADNGDPLARELLGDPDWMLRFPVLVFNNDFPFDQHFIRRRLAVPEHLTDERDMFWRVRTNAVGAVAQYLDSAYEKAVTWDSDTERNVLIDALVTTAKRDDWSASVYRENQRLLSGGPHGIGSAAGYALTHWKSFNDPHANAQDVHINAYRKMYVVLEIAEALEGRPLGDAHRYAPLLPLDVLFKQLPDIELHFRERARRPRP